jgi:hypothetical protein
VDSITAKYGRPPVAMSHLHGKLAAIDFIFGADLSFDWTARRRIGLTWQEFFDAANYCIFDVLRKMRVDLEVWSDPTQKFVQHSE